MGIAHLKFACVLRAVDISTTVSTIVTNWFTIGCTAAHHWMPTVTHHGFLSSLGRTGTDPLAPYHQHSIRHGRAL